MRRDLLIQFRSMYERDLSTNFQVDFPLQPGHEETARSLFREQWRGHVEAIDIELVRRGPDTW
jgi:hypothetical protein